MKIVLIILIALAALVAAVLLLPVGVEIKNGADGELKLYIRVLFLKLGDKPKKQKKKEKKKSGGGADALMSVFGIDKLKNKQTRAEGIKQTAKLLKTLFAEARGIFGCCVAKKLKVRVVCAADDPGDAAMSFGTCCAFVYPIVGFMKSTLKKVRVRGEDISVSCDFDAAEETFDYHICLTVRVFYLLRALLRILISSQQ